MFPARTRILMAFLGPVTGILGGITAVLAVAAMWRLPYSDIMHIHFDNLGISISTVSVGMSCYGTALLWDTPMGIRILQAKWKSSGRVLLGYGILLLVHAIGAYSMSRRLNLFIAQFPELRSDPALVQQEDQTFWQQLCVISKRVLELCLQMKHRDTVDDLATARILWAMVHVLHGTNGVVIIFSAIFALMPWSKTSAPNDFEQGAVLSTGGLKTAHNWENTQDELVEVTIKLCARITAVIAVLRRQEYKDVGSLCEMEQHLESLQQSYNNLRKQRKTAPP